MMTIARGLAYVFSGGRPVSDLNPDMLRIAGDLAGIPIPVVILAGVALCGLGDPGQHADRPAHLCRGRQ